MWLAALLSIVIVLALTGCGESKETTTTLPVDTAAWTKKVRSSFEQNPDCKPPSGASRWGCSVDSYRCQGVVVDRGWSVTCAKPGRSIAFRVDPG
jgi:hypothetical protein